MIANTKYYIVTERYVAKREFGDKIKDYIFSEGKWEETVWWKDNPENPDSVPFDGDDLCEMGDGIEEITEKQAMEIIVDLTLDFLKEKWAKDFA